MAKNRHPGYDGVDKNRDFPDALFKATTFGDLSLLNHVYRAPNPYEGKIHFDKRKNEFR